MGKSIVSLDLSTLPSAHASPSQPSAGTFVSRPQSKRWNWFYWAPGGAHPDDGCLGFGFVMCGVLESTESPRWVSII